VIINNKKYGIIIRRGKNMDALLMAGGKGTRLNSNVEKPLLKILDMPMIDYIIEELLKSKINKIYIATSKHTPQTKKYLINKYNDNKEVIIVDTEGIDYIHDLNQCIPYFSKPFMMVSCDIPSIKSKLINNIINYYNNIDNKKEALCVVIEKNNYLGNPTLILNEYDKIPAGINILSPKQECQTEEIYLVDELLININTLKDKEIVEKILLNGGEYNKIE